jgi:hypothetical protein
MRSKDLRSGLVAIALFLLATHVFGQPPAQGPPLPPPPALEFANSVIINFVKTTIQTTIDTVNAKIAHDADSTGVKAHLSFSITTFKPGMSVTTFPNRPNENVVRIAFMVSYSVTGIRYHGIPYFSRKIGQSIELNVACDNWFTNTGILAVRTRADRPFLDNNSFAEEALNFFIAHTITDLVDSKLRARLPNGTSSNTPIPTSPCNCLGVKSGSAPSFTDGTILFKKLKTANIPPSVSNATVTIQSIKRLRARALPGNTLLYKEVEDIQLEVFVNQTIRTTQLPGMREGDVRTLNLPKVVEPHPGSNGMIVLIANVAQQPLLQTDTRFAVFKKNVSFGNGTQKLIVPKTYIEPAHRLPDGRMSKPIFHEVDAYEVTVLISTSNIGFIPK